MWDEGLGETSDSPFIRSQDGWRFASAMVRFPAAQPLPVCDHLCACSAPFTFRLASSSYSPKGRDWSSVVSAVSQRSEKSCFTPFLFLILILNPPPLCLWNLLYYLLITFSLNSPIVFLSYLFPQQFLDFCLGTSSFYTLPFLFFFLNLLHSSFK